MAKTITIDKYSVVKYISTKENQMAQTHIHHIIPKHAGGGDDSDNLIELSIEDHALAHKQLWESTGNELDFVAWKALTGQIGIEEARIMALQIVCSSEEHRQKLKKPKSVQHRKKMLGNKNGFLPGHSPHNKGKKIQEYVSEDARKAWSEKMIGNKNASGTRTEETKKKMRGPRAPLTEERKIQISNSMKEVWNRRKL